MSAFLSRILFWFLDVHSLLATQESENGVKKLQQSLTEASDKAASDLQSHVYKNYSEFVVISKEISNILLNF